MLRSNVVKVVFVVAIVIFCFGTTVIEHLNIQDIRELQVQVFVQECRIRNLETHVKALEAQVRTLESKARTYNAVASWYGPGFHGRQAADGSIYNQDNFTIAHKTLPFGTIVIIEYNGKRVPAIVTDRGPFIDGREFDLSYGVAKRLGVVQAGVVEVTIHEVT